MGNFTIGKVGPESLTDYLDYFDNRAFTDNPRWQSCYCHFTYADHDAKPWKERTLEENRTSVIKLIESGQMRGYLAYSEGVPIAWCNASARKNIPLARDNQPNSEDDTIGAIVCFVVSKPFRGKGIARQLLTRALDDFRSAGFKIAEAYPRRDATSEAGNHYGPLRLYLSAGFAIHREDQDGGLVVRKTLHGFLNRNPAPYLFNCVSPSR
ncbi:MAG: GNAT family N-acetyltransferase [Anaerolineales bacterium]